MPAEAKLTNTEVNIELTFDDNNVFVWDTQRQCGASLASCEMNGQYNNDASLSAGQGDWLDSAEVLEWLDKVGY